jgi:hypothetical protein
MEAQKGESLRQLFRLARAVQRVTGKNGDALSRSVSGDPATIRLPNEFSEGEKVDRSPGGGGEQLPNANYRDGNNLSSFNSQVEGRA